VNPACLCGIALLAAGPYSVVACRGSRPVLSEPPPKAASGEPSSESAHEARLQLAPMTQLGSDGPEL
jgi:hypothetical protein